MKYMMATKAHHKLGELSRDYPDLCRVEREDKDNYYGSWVYGFGFIDVRFPKKTTRKLNKKEITKYNGSRIAINNTILPGTLKIK